MTSRSLPKGPQIFRVQILNVCSLIMIPIHSWSKRYSIDLCVSAALDAVKEHVEVPWITSSIPAATSQDVPNAAGAGLDATSPPPPKPTTLNLLHTPTTLDHAVPNRVLFLHHFNKALKEIVPSSSESLSSLSDLRKWNEEFGEGRNSRKSQQVWGRGKFGFIDANRSKEGGKADTLEKQ